MKAVTNYLKNLTRSIGYVAADIAKEDLAPNIADFSESNKAFLASTYAVLKNPKAGLKRSISSIQNSKIYQALDYGIRNTFEDLRTGNFYNKEREDRDMLKLSGLDMGDWNDLSEFGIDEDWESNINSDSSKNSEVTAGDTMVVNAIEGSNAAAASATVNAIISSSQAQIKNSRLNMGTLYMQNEKLFGGLHQDLSVLNATMSSMNKMTAASLQNLDKNTSDFFTAELKLSNERNAILKEMLEMQRNQYMSAVEKERKNNESRNNKRKSRLRWNDVNMSGMPDFEKYFENVKDNISREISSLGIPSFSEDSNMLATFMVSPLSGLVKMFVKGVIPATIKAASKELDESVSGIFGHLMARLSNSKNDDNGIFSFIAKFLGINTNVNKKLDTSKYEKGPVPFDGITRKAIIDVIPSYLRRIEANLSGKPEQTFDYAAGKWIIMNEAKKKYDQIHKNTTNAAMREIDYELKDKLKNVTSTNQHTRESLDKIISEFEEFMMSHNGIFNPKISAEKNGITSSKYPNLYKHYHLFVTLYNQISTATIIDRSGTKTIKNYSPKINISRRVLEAKDNEERQYRQLEEEGINPIIQYMSALDVDKHGTWDKDKNKFTSKENILYTKDKDTGNTIFNYLNNINRELTWQRTIGFEDLYSIIVNSSNVTRNSNSLITTSSSGLIIPGSASSSLNRQINNNQINVPMHNQARLDRHNQDFANISTVTEEHRLQIQRKAEDENRKRQEMQKKAIDLINANKAIDLEQFKGDEDFKSYMGYLINLAQKKDSQKLADELRGEQNSNAVARFLESYVIQSNIKSIDEYFDEKENELKRNEENNKNNDKNDDTTKEGFFNKIIKGIKGTGSIAGGILGATSDVITNVMRKANEHIYDLLYKSEIEDEENKKKYNGFMDMMQDKLNNTFTKIKEGIKTNIIEPFKKWLGIDKDGSLRSNFTKELKSLGKGIFDNFINANRDIYSPIVQRITHPVNPNELTENKKNNIENNYKDVLSAKALIDANGKEYFDLMKKYNINFLSYGNDINKSINDLIDKVENTYLESIGKKDLKNMENFNDFEEKLNTYYKRLGEKGIRYAASTRNIQLDESIHNPDILIEKIKNSRTKLQRTIYNPNSTDQQLILEAESNGLKGTREEKIKIIQKFDSSFTVEKADKYYDTDAKLAKKYLRYIEKKNSAQTNAYGTINKPPFIGNTMLSKGELLFDNDGMSIVKETNAYHIDKPTHILNGKDSYELLKAMGYDSTELGVPSTPQDDLRREHLIAESLGLKIKNNASGTLSITNNNKVDLDSKVILDKAKKLVPKAAAGGLVGGILSLVLNIAGGPIVGAAVGSATSIIRNSDTLKEKLFGKIGDDGKRTGDGIISKTIVNAVQRYAPDMFKYGLAGLIPGLITPLGPIGGILAGAAIGFIKNNERFTNKYFGENGKLTIGTKEKEIIQKMLPGASKGAAVGALATLFGGPFGLVGNAAVGAAVGMITSTDEFKDLIFGAKINGVREGGLVGTIKDAFSPIAEAGREFKDKIVDVIDNNIVKPISEFVTPFIHELPRLIGAIPRFLNDRFEKTFGNTLTGILKDKIGTPLGKLIQKIVAPAASKVASVVTAPVRLLGAVGNRLRNKQIKQHRADYMTAEERINWGKKHGKGDGSDYDKALAKIGSGESDALSVDDAKKLKESLSLMTDNKAALKSSRKKSEREINNILNSYSVDGASLSAKAKKKIRQALQNGKIDEVPKILSTYGLEGKGSGLTEDQINNLLGDGKDDGLKKAMLNYSDLKNREEKLETMTGGDREKNREQVEKTLESLGLKVDITNKEERNKLIKNLDTEINDREANNSEHLVSSTDQISQDVANISGQLDTLIKIISQTTIGSSDDIINSGIEEKYNAGKAKVDADYKNRTEDAIRKIGEAKYLQLNHETRDRFTASNKRFLSRKVRRNKADKNIIRALQNGTASISNTNAVNGEIKRIARIKSIKGIKKIDDDAAQLLNDLSNIKFKKLYNFLNNPIVSRFCNKSYVLTVEDIKFITNGADLKELRNICRYNIKNKKDITNFNNSFENLYNNIRAENTNEPFPLPPINEDQDDNDDENSDTEDTDNNDTDESNDQAQNDIDTANNDDNTIDSNGLGTLLLSGIKAAGRGIGKAAKAVGKGIGKAAKAVGRAAKSAGKGIIKAAKTIGNGAKKAAKAVGRGIKKVASGAKKAAKAVGKVVKKGANVVKKVSKSIKNGVSSIFNKNKKVGILGRLVGGATKIAGKVFNGVTGIAGKIAGSISGAFGLAKLLPSILGKSKNGTISADDIDPSLLENYDSPEEAIAALTGGNNIGGASGIEEDTSNDSENEGSASDPNPVIDAAINGEVGNSENSSGTGQGRATLDPAVVQAIVNIIPTRLSQIISSIKENNVTINDILNHLLNNKDDENEENKDEEDNNSENSGGGGQFDESDIPGDGRDVVELAPGKFGYVKRDSSGNIEPDTTDSRTKSIIKEQEEAEEREKEAEEAQKSSGGIMSKLFGDKDDEKEAEKGGMSKISKLLFGGLLIGGAGSLLYKKFIKPVWDDKIAPFINNKVKPFFQNITSNVGSFINDKLIPKIGEMVPNLIKGLGERITSIVETVTKILPDVTKAISDALPVIVDGINKAIPVLVQGINTLLPQITKALGDIVPPLLNGIVQILPQLAESLKTLIPELVSSVAESLGTLLPAVLETAFNLLPTLFDLPKMAHTLIDGIIDGIAGIIPGGEFIGGVLKGAVDVVSFIPETVGGLFNGVIQAFKPPEDNTEMNTEEDYDPSDNLKEEKMKATNATKSFLQNATDTSLNTDSVVSINNAITAGASEDEIADDINSKETDYNGTGERITLSSDDVLSIARGEGIEENFKTNILKYLVEIVRLKDKGYSNESVVDFIKSKNYDLNADQVETLYEELSKTGVEYLKNSLYRESLTNLQNKLLKSDTFDPSIISNIRTPQWWTSIKADDKSGYPLEDSYPLAKFIYDSISSKKATAEELAKYFEKYKNDMYESEADDLYINHRFFDKNNVDKDKIEEIYEKFRKYVISDEQYTTYTGDPINKGTIAEGESKFLEKYGKGALNYNKPLSKYGVLKYGMGKVIPGNIAKSLPVKNSFSPLKMVQSVNLEADNFINGISTLNTNAIDEKIKKAKNGQIISLDSNYWGDYKSAILDTNNLSSSLQSIYEKFIKVINAPIILASQAINYLSSSMNDVIENMSSLSGNLTKAYVYAKGLTSDDELEVNGDTIIEGYLNNEDSKDIPEININGDKEDSGKGTLSKYGRGYSKQIDPAISKIRFNTIKDNEYQTIGDSGCGPAAAVNALEAMSGMGANNVINAARYALRRGYKETDGGTRPEFFSDYFAQNGYSSQTTSNKNRIINNIRSGMPTVLMGRDPNGVSSSTPYGATPHYVTVTGIDSHGRAIVQDPESIYDNQLYSMNDLMRRTSFGVSAYGSFRNKKRKYGMGDGASVYDTITSSFTDSKIGKVFNSFMSGGENNSSNDEDEDDDEGYSVKSNYSADLGDVNGVTINLDKSTAELTEMTPEQAAVVRGAIYAVETGGQVFGKGDYSFITDSGDGGVNIVAGAGCFTGSNVKRIISKIKEKYPNIYKKYDVNGKITAGLKHDDNYWWNNGSSIYDTNTLQNIKEMINTKEGRKVQDELVDSDMNYKMKNAEDDFGITDLKAKAFYANLAYQYGDGGATKFAYGLTDPITLDKLYKSAVNGGYSSRQKVVYDILNERLKSSGKGNSRFGKGDGTSVYDTITSVFTDSKIGKVFNSFMSGGENNSSNDEDEDDDEGYSTMNDYFGTIGDDAKRVVAVAKQEVGEKEAGGSDDIIKYNAWYDWVVDGGKDEKDMPDGYLGSAQAYCAAFVSWVMRHAGISEDIVPNYRGCTEYGYKRLVKNKAAGKIDKVDNYKNARPGDIVFFTRDGGDNFYHTGIVTDKENNEKNTIHTVEGNTYITAGDEGVFELSYDNGKTHNNADLYIARPQYENKSDSESNSSENIYKGINYIVTDDKSKDGKTNKKINNAEYILYDTLSNSDMPPEDVIRRYGVTINGRNYLIKENGAADFPAQSDWNNMDGCLDPDGYAEKIKSGKGTLGFIWGKGSDLGKQYDTAINDMEKLKKDTFSDYDKLIKDQNKNKKKKSNFVWGVGSGFDKKYNTLIKEQSGKGIGIKPLSKYGQYKDSLYGKGTISNSVLKSDLRYMKDNVKFHNINKRYSGGEKNNNYSASVNQIYGGGTTRVVDNSALINTIIKILYTIADNTDKLNTIVSILNNKLGVNITSKDINNNTGLSTLKSKLQNSLNNAAIISSSSINKYADDVDNASINAIIQAMNAIASE